MIRTLIAAALLAAAVLTGCSNKNPPPPIIVVKTIHPDGTATCVLTQSGVPEQKLANCSSAAIPGWETSTVTATPTP